MRRRNERGIEGVELVAHAHAARRLLHALVDWRAVSGDTRYDLWLRRIEAYLARRARIPWETSDVTERDGVRCEVRR